MCRDYVEQYGTMVLQFIFESVDPDSVCNDLGFCMSSKAKLTLPKLRLKAPSKVCTDCEAFAADVITKLNDPNVQYSIINAVESLCSLLGDNADMCRDYVDQYGQMVIQFVLSSVDPDTVCNDLGFCMSSSRNFLQKVTGPSKVCLDCRAFGADIITKLNDPTVQNDIITAVESLCSLLGDSADMCRDYVDQYGSMVIQFILESVDPTVLCNDLGFCLSSLKPLVKKQASLPVNTINQHYLTRFHLNQSIVQILIVKCVAPIQPWYPNHSHLILYPEFLLSFSISYIKVVGVKT